jgi:F-type H+-transporting ATPase subunit gamma
MPSLKAVRTRIASVKSTQKITTAMALVAAAKLRRAQDAIVAARPYARGMAEAVSEVAARAQDAHPMLRKRTPRRITLITVTSDRGLCGGFNTNACRAAQRFVDDKKGASDIDEIRIDVVGRKGREYFKRRHLPVRHELPGVVGDTAAARAKELALSATDDYAAGRVDAVYLVYNEFKSAISQTAAVEPLLPVVPAAIPEGAGQIDFLYEPQREDLLGILLPMYLESQIYRALLESIASEFGARMSAMDSATKNAKEMIDRLTLEYNRARQAAITKELMEIVGGAEALKG